MDKDQVNKTIDEMGQEMMDMDVEEGDNLMGENDLDEDDLEEVIFDDEDKQVIESDDDDDDDDMNNEIIEDDGIVDDAKVVFSSHVDSVYSIALSPDGSSILSGGGDDVGYLWNGLTGEVIQKLEGHKDSLVDCAFNFDGSLFATASYDATVKIWNSSRLLRTLEGPSTEVEWIEWHPRGNVIMAGAEDATIWMWDASNGKCMMVFAGHEGPLTCGLWTPNGKRIISGSMDGSVRIWDPNTSLCLHSFSGHGWHEHGVVSLAIHHDQPMIAAGGQDGTVRIARLETKRIVATFDHDADRAKASAEMLTSSQEDVECCSVETVDFCSVSPWLASGGTDGVIKIFDLDHQSCRQTFSHDNAIVKVKFFNNSPMVASCGADGTSRLWDSRSGSQVRLLTKHSDMVLGFDFNQNLFVSCADDKQCRVVSLLS